MFGCKIIRDYKIFLQSAHGGVFPIIAYTPPRLPLPERAIFSGILRVEIYERVGKSVISVQRAEQMHFMAVEKSGRKRSGLRQCI